MRYQSSSEEKTKHISVSPAAEENHCPNVVY